jgi:hypothetical protein
MIKEVLTDSEAAKLFNSVSGNLDNPEKLDELLDVETPVTETPAEEPATEVAEEVTPKQDEEAQPQEAAPTEEAEKPDPLAELESLRQRYAQLEHRVKSDEGRVSAFQRKAKELEDKLAALNSASQSKPADKPASVDDSSEVEVLQAMKDLQRVDPALHKILVAQEAARKRELEQLRSTISTELAPVRQTVGSFEAEREKEKLITAIPNVTEVIRSEQFQQYKEVAPRIVREWLNSKNADDVIEGMKAYSLYLHTNGLVKTEAVTKNEPAATPTSAVVSERERKLSTSVSVTSAPAAPIRKELSESELFAEVYNQLRKEHQA